MILSPPFATMVWLSRLYEYIKNFINLKPLHFIQVTIQASNGNQNYEQALSDAAADLYVRGADDGRGRR